MAAQTASKAPAVLHSEAEVRVRPYAIRDYYPVRRTMERVTVEGDKQKGPTGAHTPDTVPANGMVKPAVAEGTRPGPKRAFDRY